ncbi:MAG: hypothetical protein WAM13_04700 [Candidatus Sulfotelmatobacter sp.]
MNDNNGEVESGKENNGHAGNGASGGASKFDWVTERSSCSLPKVFASLRVQIEADVKTRNDLRPGNSPYEFSVKDDTGEFAVLLKAPELQQSVVFTLADHAILVRDDKSNRNDKSNDDKSDNDKSNNDKSNDKSNPMFEVTAAFSDQGECRLKVNGEERDFWQVRRMALEELMFRDL